VNAGDTFFLKGGAADRHVRVIVSEPGINLKYLELMLDQGLLD
jgi:hypothetical protein